MRAVIIVALVVLAGCNSKTPEPLTDSPTGLANCVDASGLSDQSGWKDPASAVKIGQNPVGDHGDVFAVRIGDAVWINIGPVDGSDTTLTLPVNDAARSYDPVLGSDVDVTKSVWADLAAGADAASAGCAS
jgi:hypothetical protein